MNALLPDKLQLRSLVTKKKKEPKLPSVTDVMSVANQNIHKKEIYKLMLEMFPDLELMGEISTAIVLTPEGSKETTISIYNNTKKLTDSTKYEATQYLEQEIQNYYKLNKKQSKYVYETINGSGAHCVLIISRKSIDEYIDKMFRESISKDKQRIKKEHLTMESLIKTINIKKEPMVDGLDNLISFTNDPTILLTNEIIEKTGEQLKENVINKKYLVDEMFKDLEVIVKKESVIIDNLKPNDGERPLVMDIPMEAVVPIIDKHNPEEHLDYIILLDGNGRPVHTDELVTVEEDDPAEIKTAHKVKEDLNRLKENSSIVIEDNMIKIDDDTLDNIIDKRIKKFFKEYKGLDLLNSEIGDNITRIMFQRVLRQQETTLLYISKDNLIYYANEYRRNGTGKSILDSLFYNASIRALLETSAIYRTIKNNIPTKEYTITLDNDDQDPDTTSKEALDYILQAEKNVLPTGLLRPADLRNWSTRMGIIAKFKHPKLPDIQVELEEKGDSGNNYIADNSLLTYYKDKAAMRYGIPPEMVENIKGPDFAIIGVYRNEVTAKKAIKRQERLELINDKYIRAVLKEDGVVKNKLRTIFRKDVKQYIKLLKKNKKEVNLSEDDILDVIYYDFIDNVYSKLPKAELIGDGTIKDKYDDFIQTAEDYLDKRLSIDALPEVVAKEFGDKVDSLKTLILGTLADKWLKRNNLSPELTNLFRSNNELGIGDNILLEHKDFIDRLEKSVLQYLKSVGKISKANSKKLDKIIDNSDDMNEFTDNEDSDNNDNDFTDNTDKDNKDTDSKKNYNLW